MGILKRAKTLYRALSDSSLEKKDEKAKRPKSAVSLKGSPLTRLMAYHVGRGGACSLLQKVAHAAIEEAGTSNVSGSCLARSS